jgi:hypothetical protein
MIKIKKQMKAICITLLFLCTVPFLSVIFNFPNKEQRYAFLSPQIGPTHAIFKAVLQENEQIDILILGASLSMCALDPIILENELNQLSRNPLVVYNVSTNWRSEDIPYVFLNDIIEKKKVKMVIWSSIDPKFGKRDPHDLAFQIWDHGKGFQNLDELPLRSKLQYLTGSILAFPRNSYLRLTRARNFKTPVMEELKNYGPQGGLPKKLGFTDTSLAQKPTKFVLFNNSPPDLDASSMIFSTETKGNFSFGNYNTNRLQDAFIKKIGRICMNNDVKLACLKIPTFEDRNDKVVNFSSFWPDVFGTDVDLIGVAPAKLLDGLDESSIKLLYYDAHFNMNGQRFFTSAISKAIYNLYNNEN